jgi:tRNA (mo5U34)-methyltransferase
MVKNVAKLIEEVHKREWFYRFTLPDGSETQPYIEAHVEPIHETRLTMVRAVLAPILEKESLTALDMASHQGWFAAQLRLMGCSSVAGFEPRESHLDDAQLITSALGLDAVDFVRSDVDGLRDTDIEPADVVLCLGLIYHLADPITAIREAYRYCKRVCLIETQVGVHVSGVLDWGSYEFVRPIKGAFTVIDETEETHGSEASLDGICLAPSAETLVWIMTKAGFRDVSLIEPPEGSYEQHRHHKRVMAVGYV